MVNLYKLAIYSMAKFNQIWYPIRIAEKTVTSPYGFSKRLIDRATCRDSAGILWPSRIQKRETFNKFPDNSPLNPIKSPSNHH